MDVIQYIDKINSRLAQGHTSEHTFRADLEGLLSHLLPDFSITNEPSRVTDCGNPDFVITRKGVPIGYIEAKDVGKDLNHRMYDEQFERYKKGLDNLIITDYVWFQFFVRGEKVAEIRLGQPAFDNINKIEINDSATIAKFENLIKEFSVNVTQAIKSADHLAELMAGKARLLENILKEALNNDLANNSQTELTNQFEVFKSMLIHDLDSQQFADLYAQTLAYGMFAARYHDPVLETFDRDEAARLIPKSNPLLRNLFQSIAGFNIDERIKTTVDNLAEVFRHADVKAILGNFGKSTAQTDPIIHFYETFLAKYDPALRKSRGVWYTPAPVVSFIVRAVDEVLKTKFNLKDGLADNSKTIIEREAQGTSITKGRNKGKKVTEEVEVHRVQILDPATGTGTFLAETVKYLYKTRFQHMQGVWPSYVKEHLIPRLNGFELLMASYAMAHLKLDMLLSETGCEEILNSTSSNRLRIFLTNSLEEYHPDTHTLFAQWLSNEAREANTVKKETPVMVVMGNPPYSGVSANNGAWIAKLIEDYIVEPGGKKKLQERKHWLNDDYVKFMRFGQHFIEKNGEGVLAFINPHGFLDNPTFRGMRWNLLKTYDEIYTIDLHGNAKRKETAPDGSIDENVFDIEQGVSINIFVKNGSRIKKSGGLGQIYHYDLYGRRDDKYKFLENTAFKDVPYQEIPNVAPMYFMVPKDFTNSDSYSGCSLKNLFRRNSTGIVTMGDGFAVQNEEQVLRSNVSALLNNEYNEVNFKSQYSLGKNYPKWIFENLHEIKVSDIDFVKLDYRPFDTKWIPLHPLLIWRPRSQVMCNMLGESNLALLTTKAFRDNSFEHAFITRNISEAIFLSGTTATNSIHMPLYIYTEDNSSRVPNLDLDEIKAFEKYLKLSFKAENSEKSFTPSCLLADYNSTDTTPAEFTPIDILDYIYAVLHSPAYREKYKEFLKIDFPKIPYPTPETFWQLVELGDQIRLLHLMESPVLDTPITQYPIAGDNVITRKITKTSPGYEATSDSLGKVWINDTQYFDNVPLLAWEFYIGGYQPAQKWLKDRVGRELSFDDILHYQRIIVAITETDRLMNEVDAVLYRSDC